MSCKPRVVLLGFGAINSRVFELLTSRQSADIVGVIARSGRSRGLHGVAEITSAEALARVNADLVLEAASREAVAEWGEHAIRSSKQFVISSASALADDKLLGALRAAARAREHSVVLSTGAVAGIDALSAAARSGLHSVQHRIIKHPNRWAQASAPNAATIAGKPTASTTIFSGSARDAAQHYPQNANVTVVTALAGIGLDRTIVELVADPAALHNRHEIRASGNFGSLKIEIENFPLPSNPKSSQLAALALVRVVENQGAVLVQ